MDFVSISIAIFFLVIAYVTFQRFMNDSERLDDVQMVDTTSGSVPAVTPTVAANSDAVPDAKVKEVVYTQDYYPWWRSTRWWNYDGWLYQKP